MELCLHSPIPEPINLQLESQPSTFNHHLQRKVQIIELHATSRCQSCEETFWDSPEVGCEGAYVYEISRVGGWWFAVCIGCN